MVRKRGPMLTTDLDQIPKPLRHQQGHASQRPFQHRVGGHGGAVSEIGHLARPQASEALPDGVTRVFRCRRHLHHRAVHRHHIGERAAGVHTDFDRPKGRWPGARRSVRL